MLFLFFAENMVNRGTIRKEYNNKKIILIQKSVEYHSENFKIYTYKY